uniref:hypothetical protein n=1 Tax=Staphylococcus epidermidis TaxID=1282 RepID=UPI001C92F258
KKTIHTRKDTSKRFIEKHPSASFWQAAFLAARFLSRSPQEKTADFFSRKLAALAKLMTL